MSILCHGMVLQTALCIEFNWGPWTIFVKYLKLMTLSLIFELFAEMDKVLLS